MHCQYRHESSVFSDAINPILTNTKIHQKNNFSFRQISKYSIYFSKNSVHIRTAETTRPSIWFYSYEFYVFTKKKNCKLHDPTAVSHTVEVEFHFSNLIYFHSKNSNDSRATQCERTGGRLILAKRRSPARFSPFRWHPCPIRKNANRPAELRVLIVRTVQEFLSLCHCFRRTSFSRCSETFSLSP